MYGAILGDIIGSPYEFDQGDKTKDFPLFGRRSVFTDDSVMTVAVAEALMDPEVKRAEDVRTAVAASMRRWGRRYLTIIRKGSKARNLWRVQYSWQETVRPKKR